MAAAVPFCREAGQGPTVVCLHSNASHSGQWRGLMDRLADRFHVVAVDGYGAGKSPEWTGPGGPTLADEVALLAPVLARASTPAFLVGHSYGAAVALKAALLHPGRFAGLAVYEPTLFELVDQRSPPPNDADGIRAAVAGAVACLAQQDEDGAARCFIDFWMGAGAWERMPAERKPAMAHSVRHVQHWATALTTEPATLADLRALTMPVLCMAGDRSPRSSLGVMEVLLTALPQARELRFPKLGHMAPVTHPEPVNAAVDDFLQTLVR
jgi:pimeloyl-ACP methyl ester carboxylesterase